MPLSSSGIQKQIKKLLMWNQRDVGPRESWLPPPPPPPASAPCQSRVPALYAVSVLTCLLTAVIVGIRFYANKRFNQPLGKDFWTIFVAVIFCWTAGGIAIWGGTLGLGRPAGDISRPNRMKLDIVGLPSFLYYHWRRG